MFSSTMGTSVTVTELESQGYYGSVSYRFADWFELGTYYSVMYPEIDDKDGERYAMTEEYRAWLKDLCLTARFDINSNWVAKVEGHMMDGAAMMNSVINPVDENGERYEKDWFLYAVKVSYNF